MAAVLTWIPLALGILVLWFVRKASSRIHHRIIERAEAEIELIQGVKLVAEDLQSRDPQLDEHMELLMHQLYAWEADCRKEVRLSRLALKIGFDE